jgi:hypothetical protein
MDAIMSLLLTTLLSALLPVGVEGIKQLIVNKAGGVKPTTIEDQIKLDEQDIKRMQVLASLDNPGGIPSQWVIDLRGSARYISAGVVILGGLGTAIVPDLDVSVKLTALEAANIAFGFLFGQRIVVNFKK